MSLDVMYGPGTLAALEERSDVSSIFPGATSEVIEEETEDGAVSVDVSWKEGDSRIGHYRLQFRGEEVLTSGLDVEPTRQNHGILTLLIERMNHWWASIGVTRNTMFAMPESLGELVLKLAGFDYFEVDHERHFGSLIPGERLDEFVQWASAGEDPATEPEWRRGMQHVAGVF